MPNLTDLQTKILRECRIATVATISPEGFPHLTSVWFVFEGGKFLLSIPSTSAKMRNIQQNPKISILIDTRQTYSESGISVQGIAETVSGDEATEIRRKVHSKYIQPNALKDAVIGGFFESLDDIAIVLDPSKWIFWNMAELDRQVFGGTLRAKESFFEVIP
jgi:nitroimidazol reductase NimA-like FMN-containing flavoprotein (pyridoxamine 5'-phosphate oxidase superfamily)